MVEVCIERGRANAPGVTGAALGSMHLKAEMWRLRPESFPTTSGVRSALVNHTEVIRLLKVAASGHQRSAKLMA